MVAVGAAQDHPTRANERATSASVSVGRLKGLHSFQILANWHAPAPLRLASAYMRARKSWALWSVFSDVEIELVEAGGLHLERKLDLDDTEGNGGSS